jgi:trk system potassium uptake protein TrkA
LADRRLRPETVVVIGLGRFGTALARELQAIGHEVLGIDTAEELVQSASAELDLVVQGDATEVAVLRQLGVGRVQHAVVAIGDAIQASILATAALTDLEIPDIWAKAQTEQHARILERVGAHHVVFPERDMGERVAHRVTGTMLEYFEIDGHFALVETKVPARYAGRTLLDSGIRAKFDVNVVGLRPEGGQFGQVEATTVLGEHDVLLVSGDVRQVERFAAEA